MTLPRMLAGSLLTALLLPVTAPPAAADHGVDTASGHITDGFTEYDFSARSSAFGTDSRGRARVTFRNTDPDRVFAGDVTCLRIFGGAGSLAVIGVRITQAPFGNVAQGMVITAFDSGKFSQQVDAVSVNFLPTPPPQDACPSPSFLFPGDGDIKIHNTFP